MSSARPKTNRQLHRVERADLAVAKAAAIDGRTTAARRIARVAELGDQPPLRLLCGLTIGVALLRSNPKLLRTGLRMLAAHSVATAAKDFVKRRIDRTRPGEAMRNGQYCLDVGKGRRKPLTSMPSGHSAGVAAVALAVAREYPMAAAPVAGAVAASIMGAQLPAKNHYLSDLVVGAAIGLAAETVVSAVMSAARSRN